MSILRIWLVVMEIYTQVTEEDLSSLDTPVLENILWSVQVVATPYSIGGDSITLS